MKVSRNWLQTYFEKDIPSAEKLAELFTFHSFEVEGVETIGADSVIDVKVLPDRAHYALSHKGIADEVAVLTKVSPRNRYVEPVPHAVPEAPSISISDPEFCRRYVGRYVEVSPEQVTPPSPTWLKDSLEAIGQRSISLIVDLTNYVMFDIGQPMHAFDADKIKGGIVIRSAKEGEKITLLDGKEVTLSAIDSVIADDEGPLVVAGAKGGKRAEVTASTRRIMVESANFSPTAVRRTSTRHDIRTESSKRFENEITPELAIHGMNNFSALLAELLPGAKFGPVVDEYPAKPKQTIIALDPAYVSERLGVSVPEETMKDILTRMGIRVQAKVDSEGQGSPLWTLTIPFDRLDLKIKEDIVEEIGRIFGYEHIQGVLPPKAESRVPVLSMYYLVEKIRNILVEQGFSEVSLYTLVSEGEIETAKPLAKDKAFARRNLCSGIMACLEKNAFNAELLGLDAIKIFEIGHVFEKDAEKIRLALGVAQIKKVKGIKSDAILAAYLELLAEKLDTELVLQEDPIVKGAYAGCEIDLDELLVNFKPGSSYEELDFQPASPNKYKKFSLYPFIVRDIAVFVPEDVRPEQAWETIQKGIDDSQAAHLLVRHSLFDTFKKDGKVSYAFRMVFQSFEKTLTDEEVGSIMEKINAGMKGQGWEVR